MVLRRRRFDRYQIIRYLRAMDQALLTALKALSDASRLRIVGLLAGGRTMAVEELAAALDLTPGTVVHHLKRLRDAELVDSRPRPPYVEYSLRLGRLAEIGGQLDRAGRELEGELGTLAGPAPEWGGRAAARVLQSFFEGERLVRIPAQHGKRLVVLRYLAENVFEHGREYPEKELNQLLALRHPDVASLRRYLVDEGFMTRAASVYRLTPPSEWPLTGGDA
jgi:DNA-binding transcriptional ArsR family regulator